jgi:hypothetical protein
MINAGITAVARPSAAGVLITLGSAVGIALLGLWKASHSERSSGESSSEHESIQAVERIFRFLEDRDRNTRDAGAKLAGRVRNRGDAASPPSHPQASGEFGPALVHVPTGSKNLNHEVTATILVIASTGATLIVGHEAPCCFSGLSLPNHIPRLHRLHIANQGNSLDKFLALATRRRRS